MEDMGYSLRPLADGRWPMASDPRQAELVERLIKEANPNTEAINDRAKLIMHRLVARRLGRDDAPFADSATIRMVAVLPPVG